METIVRFCLFCAGFCEIRRKLPAETWILSCDMSHCRDDSPLEPLNQQLSLVGFDKVNGGFNGGDFFCLFIGNFAVEFFF